MEIKIMDHITETQVTNIIEASGGRHILKTPGTLTLVATVGSEVVGFIELERMETVTLIYRGENRWATKRKETILHRKAAQRQ